MIDRFHSSDQNLICIQPCHWHRTFDKCIDSGPNTHCLLVTESVSMYLFTPVPWSIWFSLVILEPLNKTYWNLANFSEYEVKMRQKQACNSIWFYQISSNRRRCNSSNWVAKQSAKYPVSRNYIFAFTVRPKAAHRFFFLPNPQPCPRVFFRYFEWPINHT